MDFEIRQAYELRADGDKRTLAGTAIRYGEVASIGPFKERFEAGAFPDIRNVKMDVQHERGRILTRTGAGLVLTDSADALRFEATLPETREADDTLRLVKAGILRGASIHFRAVKESLQGGVRIVQQAVLRAVSIVDDPAYKESYIEARWTQQEPQSLTLQWWQR